MVLAIKDAAVRKHPKLRWGKLSGVASQAEETHLFCREVGWNTYRAAHKVSAGPCDASGRPGLGVLGVKEGGNRSKLGFSSKQV